MSRHHPHVSRWSEWLETGQQTHGLQKIQIVLHLLWEDRQLNVDAGAFTVRPPAAPTADTTALPSRCFTGPSNRPAAPVRLTAIDVELSRQTEVQPPSRSASAPAGLTMTLRCDVACGARIARALRATPTDDLTSTDRSELPADLMRPAGTRRLTGTRLRMRPRCPVLRAMCRSRSGRRRTTRRGRVSSLPAPAWDRDSIRTDASG